MSSLLVELFLGTLYIRSVECDESLEPGLPARASLGAGLRWVSLFSVEVLLN